MTARRTRILPLLVATAALWPRAADPCAFVADGTVRVRIDAEEALIVWDAAQQTEHFIRRANFAQARGSFGFVVPTPTRPALAEAEDGVFARLARLYLRPPSRRARRARGAVGAEDGGAFEARLGSVPEDMAGRFQVIVANILAEVLVKLFDAEYGYPPLLEPLAPGGHMILSGIIDYRADIVVDAIQRYGLTLLERKQEGDWVALVVKRA